MICLKRDTDGHSEYGDALMPFYHLAQNLIYRAALLNLFECPRLKSH